MMHSLYPLIFTAVVLVLMVAALAREIARPSLVVFGALLGLLFGKIIRVDEAFAGFSNHGMLTVGLLFVASAALQTSGLFENLILRLLGDAQLSRIRRYLRVLLPVAGFSAFLNNTPIVASMIPMIKSWARRNGMAGSKLLIPLSYAAILGGTCTLIGTSTNLIVHGMLQENGLRGLGFFEITQVGLPVTLLTIGFLALISHRMLPDNKELTVELGDRTREFVVAMKVGPEFAYLGLSVQEAGLRHLRGLFLFQIMRGSQTIAPVGHDQLILEGDRLFFTGLPETIYDLQKREGLHVLKDDAFDLKNIDSDKLRTYEAVISSQSPLIGQSVRDSAFRRRYDGVILAIHRAGERIQEKVGDIVFKANDTLFILARRGFDRRWYHATDFVLVSRSLNVLSKPRWKGNLALVFMGLMVLAAALKWMPIVQAAALAAVLMVGTGIISAEEARQSVNLDVLLLIASSFGISRALQNSGLAQVLADQIYAVTAQCGPLGVAAGLYVAASLLTWVITNNAAAAIMFPVTLAIAGISDLDSRPLMIAILMGASSSFVTPIGYQTNLMVYGPGRYQFRDFVKIGLPTHLFVGLTSLLFIRWIYF